MVATDLCADIPFFAQDIFFEKMVTMLTEDTAKEVCVVEVKIDRDGCISCGLCIDTCPSVFRFADDGLAEVYDAPADSEESLVQQAADGCPVNVIHTNG